MVVSNTVDVNSVWKRFCPSLKKSLWYGATDIARVVFAGTLPKADLRPGEFWALRNISISVAPGESMGLIGPNGAGKTTLLRLIGGLLLPDKGRVAVTGRVGAMIALGTGFNPFLTGRENVFINGSVLGMSKREISEKFEEIVDFAEIDEFIDSPVRTYSSGMAMRLGFSVAAHLQPDLLLIDEVLAVGDVGFRMKCFKHLKTLRTRGTAIIVVTHNMNDLKRIADRCAVLGKGEIVFDGAISDAIPIYQNLVSERVGDDPSISPNRIVGCEVESEINDGPSQFYSGDNVRLKVTFNVESSAASLRVVINISSADTDCVMSVSSETRSFEGGLNTLALVLSDIALLPGAYFFHVSLYGPSDLEYHHRIRYAATLVIHPAKQSGLIRDGVVALPYVWEYE